MDYGLYLDSFELVFVQPLSILVQVDVLLSPPLTNTDLDSFRAHNPACTTGNILHTKIC